jgi:hypothetical protein
LTCFCPIDFYVRQLRGVKAEVSVALDKLTSDAFMEYAHYCGWALARAHARGGDAAMISGYLGGGDAFDRALGRFAQAYADQTERDHAQLVKAVKAGRIRVQADLAG